VKRVSGEESHLDDMRSAIRGDFERLEERRGEQVLLRPREHVENESHPISPCEHETLDEVRERPKRSWIDRLLGL